MDRSADAGHIAIEVSQIAATPDGLPDHAALRHGPPVLAAAREVLDGPQTSLLPAPGRAEFSPWRMPSMTREE
jgi:hypothetical protein